jgi:hypothetical protein
MMHGADPWWDTGPDKVLYASDHPVLLIGNEVA